MIDLEKIAKEHEQLFPKATAESQLWKLDEEIREWQSAYTLGGSLDELADVYIVCAGLCRWFPIFAKIILDYYTRVFREEYIEAAEHKVWEKWEINKKRKWEWNGKTYHHVENQENS